MRLLFLSLFATALGLKRFGPATPYQRQPAAPYERQPPPRSCSYRYGVWGPCTATCGEATQTRHNQVFTPDADGCPADSETRPCNNLPPCPLAPPAQFPAGPPAYKSFERPQFSAKSSSYAARQSQALAPRLNQPEFEPTPTPPQPSYNSARNGFQTYGLPVVRAPVKQIEPIRRPQLIEPRRPEPIRRPQLIEPRRPEPQVLRVQPPVYAKQVPPPTYGSYQIQQPAQAPRQPIIDNSKYPVDCAKLDDGLVENPAEKCSQKYYTCANGITFEQTCYGHLYFDVETKTCEVFSYVPACSGGHRPPTTNPPVTPLQYTPAPEFDCKNREDGPYPDPVKECSERYFVCVYGDTKEMYCAAGLFFDTKSGECDRFVKVFACAKKEYVEKEETFINDHKEPEPVDFDCRTVEDGHYADPHEKCSSRFFHCSNKIGYEKQCPGNTAFDEGFGVCDKRANIPVCSGKPRPIPPAEDVSESTGVVTVTLEDTLDYSAPVDQIREALALLLGVSSSLISKVVHPSPAVVQATVSGSALVSAQRLANSNNDLYFNYNYERIRIVSIAVVLAGPGPKPKPNYPFSCKGKADGNYENSGCEPYFWACVDGETEKHECPENTKYDSILDQCENDEVVPGCGGVPRTTLPPPTKGPAKIPPAYNCEQKEDGHYTTQPCSSEYFTCANGETYENTCPGGTKFDLKKDRCSQPEELPECGGAPVPEYGRPQISYGRPPPPRLPVRLPARSNPQSFVPRPPTNLQPQYQRRQNFQSNEGYQQRPSLQQQVLQRRQNLQSNEGYQQRPSLQQQGQTQSRYF